MSLRVLVVDDAVVFRRLVTEALAQLSGIEVVGAAANGKLALSQIRTLRPDLVILDIEMPELNGLQVLEAMGRAGDGPGTIVLSSQDERGGRLAIRALELGAFDFVGKPEAGGPEQSRVALRDRLGPLVRAYGHRRPARSVKRAERPRPSPAAPPVKAVSQPRPPRAEETRLVVIGLSTGGPAALATVLPCLPASLGVPVLIAQHMPATFTAALAASLDAKCDLRITEAVNGETAMPNRVYIAPGQRHLKVAAGGRGEIVLRVNDDPPEHNCRPSVDYLFRSVARHFPGRSVAVIMTGMGSDGTLGMKLLKRTGCPTIAQDEATSVVFGMPRETIRAGVVDTVAPLEEIAGAIARSVAGAGR